MDTDQWLKAIPIITTIIFSASTLWLAIKQARDGNKNARREEYKFAKIFFEDLKANPGMHAFARKKGFQAIGQNQTLPPSVIEHLMTFRDPVAALSDYEFSRGYLKHSEELGPSRLSFASSFLLSTEKRRNILTVAYVTCAVLFYIFAFTPWFLITIGKVSVSVGVNALIFSFPIGLSVTILCAREAVQLRRAMRLIKAQNDQVDEVEVAIGEVEANLND